MRNRNTGDPGAELKSPQTTKGSPSACRFTKVASVRASWSWFGPQPILAGCVQNPRANGVGSEMWVLKTWSRRPEGSATWMWAQMRACLRSRKRSTWWWVM